MAEGTYSTFKHISSGGMAELYLGVVRYESGFKKVCAIKRILREHAGKQTFIELMRSEARIGATLNHVNVVHVLGFGQVEGLDSLIMEYVEGVDLERLLERCNKSGMAVSLPMTLMIGAEVARALAYVHDRIDHSTGRPITIIHADISPSNVLVSYEGEIKLGDFGIACARIRGDAPDAFGIRGKVSYMAPEQAEGEELTPATDIFGLGLVMWEMLTGRKLLDGRRGAERFEALDPEALQRRLQTEVAELPPEIGSILAQCLSIHPKDRYTRASDLERDLLEYMQTHYGSYTRQRVGTFVKTLFSRERDEVQATIREAINSTQAPRIGGAKPAEPPPRGPFAPEESLVQSAQRPAAPQPLPVSRPAQPLSQAPEPVASRQPIQMPTVMPEENRLHKGRDLTLVDSVPEEALRSLPARPVTQAPAIIGDRHSMMPVALRGEGMGRPKRGGIGVKEIAILAALALAGAAAVYRKELAALVGSKPVVEAPARSGPPPRVKPAPELKRPAPKGRRDGASR